MADSKITALTSISTSSDPANDPLVIVDVSDTSMAATGTTKKVTLNQLLATSPTATDPFPEILSEQILIKSRYRESFQAMSCEQAPTSNTEKKAKSLRNTSDR